MKVLVTGANGFLGAHVVRKLLAQGKQVRAFVRKGSDLRALHGLKLEYFFGQISEQKDVFDAIKGCNYVIHAAARTAQAPSTLDAYIKPNIDSTKYLIEACKKFRVKRLVFVSTANCFGNGSKTNPGNETTPFLPWLKKSGYAYSKYLAQELVLKEAKNSGFDAVIVNPTFLIGSMDYKPSSGQIFGHVLGKKIVMYPPGGKNFVDAEMAATALVNAMECGRKGECYLLAGGNYSYLEFFRMVQKYTGQKSRFIPIPAFILRFAGAFGMLREKLLKVPVRLNAANARMLCLGNYFTAEKAISELDFRNVALEESIEKAILWFKENNYFTGR